jgi:hypothetical protein
MRPTSLQIICELWIGPPTVEYDYALEPFRQNLRVMADLLAGLSLISAILISFAIAASFQTRWGMRILIFG